MRKNHIYVVKTCELTGHPRTIGYFSNLPAAETTLEHSLEIDRKFRMANTQQSWDTNEVHNEFNLYEANVCCYSVGDLKTGLTFYYIQKKVLWDEPKIF